MNLEESDAFVEEMEANDRKKKNVLMIIISCAVLVVILLMLIMYLSYEDARKFKLFIDGNVINNYSTIILNKKGNIESSDPDYYINIEQLAKSLGYTYQNGEYKSYTEDKDSCYIRTPYEIVSMKANSKNFSKYIQNKVKDDSEEDEKSSDDEKKEKSNSVEIDIYSKDETQKIFYIDKPIEKIDGSLYAPISEIPTIFNVQLDTSEKNRVKIYSLDNLINNYSTKIATNYKYSTVSNIYENFTAMADDMLVVGDGTNYGVVSISTGKEIISLKYENIVYMQNTKEFRVSVENSVGVISNKGETIIKPTEYDDITVLDELKKLYLVQKNGKYGVINHDGDDIIFCEYDSIGIENPEIYIDENVRNYNLLFEEFIPVKIDEKYGLMDLDGNEILKVTYDYFGNIPPEEKDEQTSDLTDEEKKKSKNQESGILTIPESVGIHGIIVQSNNLYGIFDANVKHLITPCVFSKIYSKTKSGVTNYYLEYNGIEIELGEYLEENELKSVADEEKEDDLEEVDEEESDEQDENLEESYEE